jgi:hypothetical protein
MGLGRIEGQSLIGQQFWAEFFPQLVGCLGECDVGKYHFWRLSKHK